MKQNSEHNLISLAQKLQRDTEFSRHISLQDFTCFPENFARDENLLFTDYSTKAEWGELRSIDHEFVFGFLTYDKFFADDSSQEDDARILFLQSVGFKEGLLAALRLHGEKPAIRFCQRLANIFQEEPSHFFFHERKPGIRRQCRFESVEAPLPALVDNSADHLLSHDYSGKFYVLNFLSCLFPNHPDILCECLEKIPSISLQCESVLYPIVDNIYRNDNGSAETLFAIMPCAAEADSLRWNRLLMPLSILQAHWLLLKSAMERNEKKTIDKILLALQTELPKRKDVAFLALVFGSYMIHALRGNTDPNHPNNQSTWNRACLMILEVMQRCYPISAFYPLEEVLSCYGESLETLKLHTERAQQTGILAKQQPSFLLPFLALSFFPATTKNDERAMLLTATFCSHDRLHSFFADSDKFCSFLHINVANFIVAMPDPVAYCKRIRFEHMAQIFYRHRFCHLRSSTFEIHYPISFYLRTMVAIIDTLISQGKFFEAREILVLCWNDISNMCYLVFPLGDLNLSEAFQNLFVYKVLYLSDPLCDWDNSKWLERISSFPALRRDCLGALKLNLKNTECIQKNDLELYKLIQDEVSGKCVIERVP